MSKRSSAIIVHDSQIKSKVSYPTDVSSNESMLHRPPVARSCFDAHSLQQNIKGFFSCILHLDDLIPLASVARPPVAETTTYR